MKLPRMTLVGALAAAAAQGVAWDGSAAELNRLNVLYVGDVPSERANAFEQLLQNRVARVSLSARAGFEPATAANWDVVLLDWPQSERTREEWLKPAPLGPRESWQKPTVLLGSAGLNLAVVWKVRGGSG